MQKNLFYILCALILLPFFVAACPTSSVAPDSLSGRLASISLFPTSATMHPGQTQTFTATARNANGDVLPVPLMWAVTGGIGQVCYGQFTATGCGIGSLVVTRGYRFTTCVSGEAIITITPTQGAAGALSSIVVSPNPTTVTVGHSQAFSATGYDASGNPIAITPVWSVTGGIGNITQTGNFTATNTGQGNVVATDGGISGQAGVTVEADGGTTTFTPVVSSIWVLPATVEVVVTESCSFAAFCYDQNNNIMEAAAPLWSVINGIGTISSGGLFTASAEGTGRVRASASAVYGDALVTVEAY